MPPILLTLGLRDTEIQRGLFKFVALSAIGSKWMAMCWTLGGSGRGKDIRSEQDAI